MRRIFLAAALLLFATASSAQVGFDAGMAVSWASAGDRDIDLVAVQGGILYDHSVRLNENDEGIAGITVMGAAFKEEGVSDDEAAFILAMNVGWWQMHSSGFVWSLQGRYELFPEEIWGERSQALGGRAALMLPLGDEYLEVSYHMTRGVTGVDDLSSAGLFFGPRVSF